MTFRVIIHSYRRTLRFIWSEQKYECKPKIESEKKWSNDCHSNHETMAKDGVQELFLLTFDWIFIASSFFTVFKSKLLILFRCLFKNNIKYLKSSSKLKRKSCFVKCLCCIVMEKQLVKFTFKLTFVNANVTESNHILQEK